mgnify:CR=1 FL=1
MLKLNKKGFTVVELVIVIAVVAILAAVLIPTFINLMQTANESADIQLVTNLNKIMAMQEALDGKNATMQDALDDAFANGYDIAKISPTSKGNDIVWDQTADRFALVNAAEKKLIFRDDATPIKDLNSGEIYTLWKIYTEAPGESDPGFSIYWNGSSAPLFTKALTVGFDAGECSGISNLNYDRNSAKNAQTVVFRTNGGDLTVNAGKDTVKHYGEVNNVTITAVAGDSYHEFGKVSGKIEITAGRFVDETGMISNITVLGAGVKIDTTRTDLLVINFGTGISSVELNKVVTSADTGSSILAVKDGKNVNEEVVVVNTIKDLKEAVYFGKTAIINSDITSSNVFAFMKEPTMTKGPANATINLNGHTLKITGSQNQYMFALTDGAKLTIEGTGKLETTTGAPIFDVRNATLTINGGEFIVSGNKVKKSLITVSASEGHGNVIINNGKFMSNEVCIGMFKNAVVEINGGEFTSKDNFVIGTNGSKEYGNNTITINGGTFNGSIASSGYIACGIYLANNDTLTVNGGTFNITNGVGILVRSGKATIGKDVVIHATGTAVGKIGDSNVNLSAPAAIVKDEKSDYPGGAPTIINNSAYEVVDISKK